MAEICEWKSDTSFDDKLERIDHYKIHREMLPFIGTQYNQTKILLVGESHYIKSYCELNDSIKKYYDIDWYLQPVPADFPDSWWFNTRTVVHNFLTKNRSRSHSMFRNPSNVMQEVWDLCDMCDSYAFDTCAYMNYFQRPASNEGETMDNTDQDNNVSLKTFNCVINAIGAKTVIFLSKTAYKQYVSSIRLSNNSTSVCFEYVNHPTCPHWYNERGKDKFTRILSELHPEIKKVSFLHYKREDVEKTIKNNTDWRIIKSVRWKTCEHQPMVKIYVGEKYVTEVVAYTVISHRKIGIGYLFDYRSIWIWDYDLKEYVTSADDDITDFCNKFVDLIKQI